MIKMDRDITLWVVRHGYRVDFMDKEWRKTAENPYNPPLASVGFEQALETGCRLKAEKIDHIIASPFLRTVQTANIIADKLGKKICLEEGLSEYLCKNDFNYRPELDSVDQLAKEFSCIDMEHKTLVNIEYPEDRDELDKRVEDSLIALIDKYGSNLLLISHGSPIRSIFKALIGYDGDEYPPMCSVSKFCCTSGKWTLVTNSDSKHLTQPDNTKSAFYKERWDELEEERKAN